MTGSASIRDRMADRPRDIEGWLKHAIEKCVQRGAEYADVRFGITGEECYRVKNGSVDKIDVSTTGGFGLRVLAGGHWGFASRPGYLPDDVDSAIESALALAKAAAGSGQQSVRLTAVGTETGRYSSPVLVHPLDVPVEKKIELLLHADALMAEVSGLKVRKSEIAFYYQDKWFASTEGSYIEQSIVESGGGLMALAVGGGDAQLRAYPELMGDQVQAGWEFVERLDLPGNAKRVASEAVELLTAPECPAGEFDVIISGSQIALQVHESCGHPSELDRVMGVESDVAGTSFLTLDQLGRRKYGSPEVSITADATLPGGLGSFGWDDEGVPARRSLIIDRGIHTGYLTSRQYVAKPGDTSGGNARACSWSKPPIVRMTNINLLPGTASFREIVSDTKYGLLFDGQKTWSIDDRRLNFAFGCQAAWEIVNGKIGRLMKNPSYTGTTPEVWGRCDAVAGPESWRVWGLTGCGKGAPMQNLHVGHGTSPARFRGLKVGVAR